MSKSIRSVLDNIFDKAYKGLLNDLDLDQALKDIAQIIDEAKPEYIQALPSDNISAMQRGAVDQYQSNLREALIMSKRICPLCSQVFNNKSDFIEHLKEEYEDHMYEAETAQHELEKLGVDYA